MSTRLGANQARFETGDHTNRNQVDLSVGRSTALEGLAVKPCHEIDFQHGPPFSQPLNFVEGACSGAQDFQHLCPGRHRHFGLDGA